MKYLYQIPYALIWTAILIVSIPFLLVGLLFYQMDKIGRIR